MGIYVRAGPSAQRHGDGPQVPTQALSIQGFGKRSSGVLGMSSTLLGEGSTSQAGVGSWTQLLQARGPAAPCLSKVFQAFAHLGGWFLEPGCWRRTGRTGRKGTKDSFGFSSPPRRPQIERAKAVWEVALKLGEDNRGWHTGENLFLRPGAGWVRGIPVMGNRSGAGRGAVPGRKAGRRRRGELEKDERGKGDLNWERRGLKYRKEIRMGLVERGLERTVSQNLSGF